MKKQPSIGQNLKGRPTPSALSCADLRLKKIQRVTLNELMETWELTNKMEGFEVRRRLFILATVLMAMLMLVNATSLHAVKGQRPTEKVKEIAITAYYWSFEPSTIIVDKNDTVRLRITSVNNMMPMMTSIYPNHGIEIEGYDIDYVLPLGETVTIEFVANKNGTFHFHCSIYCGIGHEDMHGELIVNGSDSKYSQLNQGDGGFVVRGSWMFLAPVFSITATFVVIYFLFSKTKGRDVDNREEKPVAAFILSIVGVAFQVAAAIFWTYALFFYPLGIKHGSCTQG